MLLHASAQGWAVPILEAGGPARSMAFTATLVTLALLLALLRAEQTEHRGWLAVIKPLTSIGFLATAWLNGAFDSSYGAWIFAGLVAGFWGDVFLLSARRSWFLAGLVVFLLGHLAYAVAFAGRGVDSIVAGIALVGAVAPGWVVWRWLRPNVDAPMRVPVLAYVVVISVMLALAVGTIARAWSPSIIVGAVAFYASDIAVARERFVASGFINRLWGLPAYYVGQLLLAWSV
jgi:uncharacterized membrane protein YhhN